MGHAILIIYAGNIDSIKNLCYNYTLMNPEFDNKTQPELFEDYKKIPFKRLRFKTQVIFSRPKPNITISYENFIFLVIGFILFGIVSFSLGVERGRYIYRKEKAPSLPEVKNIARVPQEEKFGIDRTNLYTVQVASFKKLEAAEKEAGQLKASGYEVSVVRSGDYFRVCVGNFNERREADRVLANLKKKFADCYVTER